MWHHNVCVFALEDLATILTSGAQVGAGGHCQVVNKVRWDVDPLIGHCLAQRGRWRAARGD